MSCVTIRNVSPRSRLSAAHQRDDLGRVLAVEVAGRLVGPDDRRVVDERARDRHALPLTAGQLVRQVRGALGEADHLERRERLAPRLAARATRATSSGSSTFSTALRTGIRL